jgi:hypothetical protein
MKNVPSKIHHEKLHYLQDHSAQTSKIVFLKYFLTLKFYLLKIFQKKSVSFLAPAT